MLEAAKCPVTTFGIDSDGDVRAENVVYYMDRSTFDVSLDGKVYSFELHVPGRFSVYNALGVIAAARMLNIPADKIVEGINAIKGVPGRIQNIPNDKGFNVIVDYAHTPDGVEKS